MVFEVEGCLGPRAVSDSLLEAGLDLPCVLQGRISHHPSVVKQSRTHFLLVVEVRGTENYPPTRHSRRVTFPCGFPVFAPPHVFGTDAL